MKRVQSLIHCYETSADKKIVNRKKQRTKKLNKNHRQRPGGFSFFSFLGTKLIPCLDN